MKVIGVAALVLGSCAVGCWPESGLKERPIAQDGGTGGKSEGTTGSAQAGDTGGRPGSGGSGQSGKPEPVSSKSGEHRVLSSRIFQLDNLEQAEVSVDGHKFRLWVMDTDAKRSEGMMFLENKDFKDDEGMVFAFGQEAQRRFWMRNTLVDLDVCYCDKSGKVLNTYTMKAHDETTDYSSAGPSQFVIELRAGTVKKRGIKDGSGFQIPKSVVSKDGG
ncbi:MAG: DUF192 domain-containing protein [Armatimonadetes bacterium]|nr:DUF192 domain-containing protein [Armatimonadota bacterium]